MRTRRMAILSPAVALVAALVACAAAIFAMAGEADAAFPGENGRIVFSSGPGWWSDDSGPYGIYTVEPDGADLRKLTPDGNDGPTGRDPSYSPDGAKIAFSGKGPDVWVMNADGSGVHNVTDLPQIMYAGSPTWSPDGTRIAFRSDGKIYTVRPDGTGLRLLSDGPPFVSRLAWSPDGTKMAFLAARPGPASASDVWVMDADGSDERAITDASTGYRHTSFDWSPDGSEIAFSSIYDEEAAESGAEGPFPYGIFVTHADGSDKTKVAENPGLAGDVAWSPDGEKLTVVTANGGVYGPGGLYTMNADGSGITNILPSNAYDANYESPDWQPLGGTSQAPLETTIISGPSGTTDSSASFDYVSSRPGSTFECSLDRADFSPCEAPKSYSGLPTGPHTFDVRAVNEEGAPDASPARRTWNVIPPDIPPMGDEANPVITRARPVPGSLTRDRTPAIGAVVRDAGHALVKTDIRLRVDGSPRLFSYDPAIGGLSRTLGRLNYGRHTVEISAKDAAGNRAAKTWSFRVVRG